MINLTKAFCLPFVMALLIAAFFTGCTGCTDGSDTLGSPFQDMLPVSSTDDQTGKPPHRCGGGTITDGANFRSLAVNKSGATEEITLTFDYPPSDDYLSVDYVSDRHTVPSYSANYTENPGALIMTIGGVRRFDAAKSFPDVVTQSDYVSDVYPRPLYDDSAVSFLIVFSKSVYCDFKAYESSGRLVITVTESSEQNTDTVYSLRTPSVLWKSELNVYSHFAFDLTLGNGHRIANAGNHRVMKDREGSWIIEIGCYSTRAEAESDLGTVKRIFYTDQECPFFIEERKAQELPKKL